MFCIIVHFKSLEEVAVYDYMAQLGLQNDFYFFNKTVRINCERLIVKEGINGSIKT